MFVIISHIQFANAAEIEGEEDATERERECCHLITIIERQCLNSAPVTTNRVKV